MNQGAAQARRDRAGSAPRSGPPAPPRAPAGRTTKRALAKTDGDVDWRPLQCVIVQPPQECQRRSVLLRVGTGHR
jgi:hypothetical protein